MSRDLARRRGLAGATLLALILGGCASDGGDDHETSAAALDRPVAVVRTRSLQWDGEQTYIPLYADGTASGLVVVNLEGGRLYGTGIPDSWTWQSRDTVKICATVEILRNEVDFPPMDRDCGLHPITGKELDLDGDGNVDLVETFTVLDPMFHRERPHD